MALSQWLAGPIVMASTTAGRITVAGLEHSVTAVNPPTTEWLYFAMNPRETQHRRSEQYLSFNTPVGTPEPMQCGKAVFTDIHIKQSLNGAGGDDSDPGQAVPDGLQDQHDDASGEGARVPVLRSHVVRRAADDDAAAADRPPAGDDDGAAAGGGKPPAVPPPPPPPPAPDPRMIRRSAAA